MYYKVLFCFIVTVLNCASANDNNGEFEYFDDYLRDAIQRQIDLAQLSGLVGVPDDVMISDQSTNTLPRTPNLDVLSFFRDVPKRHWSCCLLGKLAGDKGFHCQAQFYADRALANNRNRPHNRLMPFNGPARDVAYGRALMEHFSRCVSRKEHQFHTCCYAATMERQALTRWRRIVNHEASLEYRHQHQQQ